MYHLDPLEEMLGFKIPVERPDDDYFPEDAAPGFSLARRGHSAKRSKTAVKQAPAKTRDGRKSQPPVAAEKPRASKGKSVAIAKTSDYFPGTFFGFMPPEMVKVVKGINYIKPKSVLSIDEPQAIQATNGKKEKQTKPKAKKADENNNSPANENNVAAQQNKNSRNYRKRSSSKNKPAAS